MKETIILFINQPFIFARFHWAFQSFCSLQL